MAENLEMRHVVGKSVVKSGLMALKPMATSEHTEMLHFVRVSNLLRFIDDTFENLLSEQDPSLFNNEIWILFAGHKGGENVKIHAEINSISCGSVDNVHLYCMFEGADTLENMWKVLGIVREQSDAIHKDDFNIRGRRVKAFLGSEFHFIDNMLCHQGSASTFLSSIDLVTL